MTELLQNAVDHGFPEGSGGGDVAVVLDHQGDELALGVIDNGQGVERGFDLATQNGLGLSIVRTLVTTELNGTIDMRPATAADLDAVGLGDGTTHGRGTVVELSVTTAD